MIILNIKKRRPTKHTEIWPHINANAPYVFCQLWILYIFGNYDFFC